MMIGTCNHCGRDYPRSEMYMEWAIPDNQLLLCGSCHTAWLEMLTLHHAGHYELSYEVYAEGASMDVVFSPTQPGSEAEIRQTFQWMAS